jgi:mannose-6-phosphate isomerase
VKLLELFSGMNRGEDRPAVRPSAALWEVLKRLRSCLEEEGGLALFLTALLGMEKEARHDLGVYAMAQAPQLERDYPDHAGEWLTVAYFAQIYPDDPAVIAPLYLNLIRLKPGEAVYVPAGVLHAYIEGLGVELMANSDNVLRGGLTPKHVDAEELKRVLHWIPFKPEILISQSEAGGVWETYPTSCREFSLATAKSEGEAVPWSVESPAIILVSDGEARLQTADGRESLDLKQGESAFIAGDSGELSLSGAFTAYAASVGSI